MAEARLTYVCQLTVFDCADLERVFNFELKTLFVGRAVVRHG